MVITEPVYFVTIRGDYKEKALSMGKTILSTYEPQIDTTYIVSKAQEVDLSNYVVDYYKSLHKRLKKSDITVTYSFEGINFITLNNN